MSVERQSVFLQLALLSIAAIVMGRFLDANVSQAAVAPTLDGSLYSLIGSSKEAVGDA